MLPNKEIDGRDCIGCVFCVYEMEGARGGTRKPDDTVPAAITTIETKNGPRDVCEAHARSYKLP